MNLCQMDSKFRAGMNVTMRPGTALYTQMNDLHYELGSVFMSPWPILDYTRLTLFPVL